jgi:tRNA(Ile)-lysidine synthase
MELCELLEQNTQSTWPIDRWAQVSLVIGVSGGADSVALLRLLTRLKPQKSAGKWLVAHYNHQLRGAESQADEHFVQELANSLGLTCVTGQASAKPTHFVSENSAREARYAFLRETAHQWGARYLLVAHTADDQAETILFRALRGTSLRGLQGMPASRPLSDAVTLLRPLLAVRRQTLRDYLQQLEQPFREDSSNQDARFARNMLRQRILPRLAQEYDPAICQTLLRLGSKAAELHAAVHEELAPALQAAVTTTAGGFRVEKQPLPRLSRHALRELFVLLWRRCDWPRGEMGQHHWEALVLMLYGERSVRIFPGKVRVEQLGDCLLCQRK